LRYDRILMILLYFILLNKKIETQLLAHGKIKRKHNNILNIKK
jgi:hypothetical protein